VEKPIPSFDFDAVSERSELNLKEVFWKYLIRWQWITLGLVAALVSCHYYIKYTYPQYESAATVLIKDESKGKRIDEISAFQDLGIISSKNNLENEIEILKSRSLMKRVIEELNLNISFFIERSPLDLELYRASPIEIRFMPNDTGFTNKSASFSYARISDSEFELNFKGRKTKHLYGKMVNIGFGVFSVLPTEPSNPYKNLKINVQIQPYSSIAAIYSLKLKVEPVNSKSNVIRISLRDPVRSKGTDVLNSLIRQYREDAIEDKNQVSINTSEFINDRIRFITAELSDVENKAETFKTRFNFVDIPAETELYLSNESDIEKEIVQTSIQLQLSKYVYNYLLNAKITYDLLPANLGLTDLSIVNMIDSHNKHVLNRNRIQKSSTTTNPLVVSLEDQIVSLRQSIKASLSNLISTYELKAVELEKREKNISRKIATVPRQEREFREIQRQQQIKEALYLYLLQKREETAIALAVTVSNAKVIDAAYSSGSIAAPNKRFYYTISMLVGLLVPILLIYLLDLFNTKVRDKNVLSKLQIPYLGEIPTVRGDQKLSVKINDKSSVSESFRSVRTNIAFMLDNSKDKGQVLFVTSTLAREGKTFVAINLAAIFAASKKKVLLIGLDLRRQKLLDYLGLPHKKGLTNHLIDSQSTIDDFIFPLEGYDNLFILPAGDIPPNPAELLMSDRVGEVFNELKTKFEYIIVDTAPAGLVTDTLLAAKHADAVVYLIRAGHTDKRSLHIPEAFYREKKLPNMALVLNDAPKSAAYGYPYGYSYSYGAPEKPFWKRWLRLN
jgi:capsular exopolysaccharide synthesis family protein